RRPAGGVDAGHADERGPGGRDRRAPLAGPADPFGRGGEMATPAVLDHQQGSRVRRKRTKIVDLYTHPPDGAVVVCADELGPVVPRAFPPAPGWSPGGHRIKAWLDYSRGPEKTWVYGNLRLNDGIAVTMTAPSRSSRRHQHLLAPG